MFEGSRLTLKYFVRFDDLSQDLTRSRDAFCVRRVGSLFLEIVEATTRTSNREQIIRTIRGNRERYQAHGA